MVDNVVQLQPRTAERLVWVCGCGSTSHYLYSDGEGECAACAATTGAPGDWRARLPDTPETAATLDETNFKVVNLGDAPNFLRRHIKDNAIAAVVIVHNDGTLSTWRDAIAHREAWLRDLFEQAWRRLTGGLE
jgi:hypothetical protein